MKITQKIAPCLWFDGQAEAAANFYVGIFRNSRITQISRYGKESFEIHRHAAGSVMTVAFELDGQPFTALNGGPEFRFNEAISFQVFCDTQEEIDGYWNQLCAGGDEQAQICGWLKDKFGVSWQIVPSMLPDMVSDPESPNGQRAMKALMQMKKLDIAELKRAYAG